MPSPATIEIEPLLAPIPGDNPSGVSLAYSAEYDQIREARRSDEDINQGDWKRELKVADWDLVVDLCSRCLATKTKDLQIAAWLTEALTRLHGLAGMRDGLVVLKAIQATFWESYYPEIEDGDLESRYGPFLFLNDPVKGLPSLIRGIQVTRGLEAQDYSVYHYRESRDTENLIKKDPNQKANLLKAGRIVAKQFDDAVDQTPKGFYVALAADLNEARAALMAFADDTDERFGRDAPSLLESVKAIDECARVVEPILAAKRLVEPDPLPELPAESAATEGAEGGAEIPAPSANGSTPGSGSIAFDGVAVPNRRARLGTPREGEAPDFGRILIDFRDRAAALAEAGAKLAANREQYGKLLEEMSRLDEEYEELSGVVSRNQQAYQLLAKLLSVSRG